MNYRPYIDPNKLPPINYGSNNYVNNKETSNELMFKRNLDTSLYIQNNAPIPTYFNEQYQINRKNADILSQRENGNGQYYQFQRNAANNFLDFSQPINPVETKVDYSKYIETPQNTIKYFCPRCKSTDLLLSNTNMECNNCDALLKRPM